MIEAFLNYSFMQNAVYSALLASIVCGIIGAIVVEKKLVMMSGGIAHTSFGGIGLGYLLGIEPIIGALFFSVLSAVGIVAIRRRLETGFDTLIGIFWSLGMALGILFIYLTPGYPPDLSSYLFGDILTVTGSDIKLMLGLTLVVVLVFVSLFKYWQAYLFDSEFAAVAGLKTGIMDYFLYILIALAVVVLIRLVGIILVIALLTAPPALAGLFTRNFRRLIIYSILLGILFSLTGLVISYYLEIASGASIILLAGFSYLIAILIKNITSEAKV